MDNLANKYIRIYLDNNESDCVRSEGICTGVGDGFIFLTTRNGMQQCFPICKINRVIIMKMEMKT